VAKSDKPIVLLIAVDQTASNLKVKHLHPIDTLELVIEPEGSTNLSKSSDFRV